MNRWTFGTPASLKDRPEDRKESFMLDVIYIAVTILFFVIAIGYTYACERL